MSTTPMPRLLVTFATVLLFLMPLPALAVELGSPAWVLANTDLNSGPGNRYPATGQLVSEGDAVVVSRCTGYWCRLLEPDGWIYKGNLSFGKNPERPFFVTREEATRGGSGEVCLFDGANYSGTGICLSSGAIAPDLVLLGWDNRISSVSIDGNVSVNLCRDRNFTSYCVVVEESTANLERLLNNSISSYQVY